LKSFLRKKLVCQWVKPFCIQNTFGATAAKEKCVLLKEGRNLEAAHSTQQVELLNSAFFALLLHMFRGTLLSSPAGDL
jgi:hypothetical protein